MLNSTDRATRCLLPLDVALFRACKDRRGAVGAIAEIYGLNANTLALKINPDRDTHNLNPSDIEAITSYTKDPRIMDSMCAAHGNAAWFELPDFSQHAYADLFALFGELSSRMGELGKSLFAALSDGRIDSDELAELQRIELQLIGVTRALIDHAGTVGGVNNGR